MKKINLNLKGNIVNPNYGENVGFWMYTVNLGVQIRQGVSF